MASGAKNDSTCIVQCMARCMDAVKEEKEEKRDDAAGRN